MEGTQSRDFSPDLMNGYSITIFTNTKIRMRVVATDTLVALRNSGSRIGFPPTCHSIVGKSLQNSTFLLIRASVYSLVHSFLLATFSYTKPSVRACTRAGSATRILARREQTIAPIVPTRFGDCATPPAYQEKLTYLET